MLFAPLNDNCRTNQTDESRTTGISSGVGLDKYIYVIDLIPREILSSSSATLIASSCALVDFFRFDISKPPKVNGSK